MIKKNIPNAITCCNLISGCIATTMAFLGDVRMALLWIIIGAVFDFFDGMSARLLKVSSPIGKELDSLADDITFGVAPSTIVFYALTIIDYPDFLEPLRSFLPFFAFVMAAFSALRLAKFNLDERQTNSFIGLPTPANALFWGSLVLTLEDRITSFPYMVFVLLALVCVSCWLLVCELPMFALKFKHWSFMGNEVKYTFMGLSLLVLAGFGFLRGWWIVIALYFLISLVLHLKGRSTSTANDK